jgi:hypothetical protein
MTSKKNIIGFLAISYRAVRGVYKDIKGKLVIGIMSDCFFGGVPERPKGTDCKSF